MMSLFGVLLQDPNYSLSSYMVTGKFAHKVCSESVKEKKHVGFSSSKIGAVAMFGCQKSGCLDGGFKDCLFSPLFGEDSHFDYYFSKGLKPPTSC